MHPHISFQTTPSMSSSHPYTAVDDEDDTDICPVCDGQCTCSPELGIKYQPNPPAPTSTPSLKIKFTLPPSLMAKRQQSLSSSATDPYTTAPLKKRGRPPKQPVPPPEKSKTNPTKIKKVRQNLRARAAAITKKVVKRRRVAVQSDQDESYYSDTLEASYKHDGQKLPTFVSASALSSISSTSDSSSSTSCLSDFDSDADSDAAGRDNPHLKTRSPARDWVIRPREKSVGGSDAEQMNVDTDDQAENQIDQDEDEQEEEAPDGLHGVEEDDEDTDSRHRYVGLATGWSEEDESSFDADLFFANLSDSSSTCSSSSTFTRRRSHSYTPGGIDADQSSSTSESPIKTALPFEVTENWDGQLIFTNGLVGDAESRGIVDIDFERDAERFIVDSDADDDSCSSFSGLDHDQLNYDPPSTAHAPESSDIDMFSISDVDAGYEEDGGEADEGETTDEELVGDDSLPNERAMRLFTLPTSISMGISAINPMSTIGGEKRRHRRGMDVRGERGERRWRRGLRSAAGPGTDPRTADILAGKIVFCEDESREGYTSSSSNSMVKPSKGKGKQKASSPSSPVNYPRHTQIPNTPRTGVFVPTGEMRQAVIGEDRKGTDVPSPHPRFYGRRNRVSVVQYLLRKHLQSQSPSPVVPPPAATASTNSVSSPSIISDASSPFHHLLSSSAASPNEDLTSTPGGDEYDTGNSTPCPCPAELEVNEPTCIVQLDDVLEASFLDDSIDRECEPDVGSSLAPSSGATLETATAPSVDSTAAEASNKHLTRWDVISISAFRQTREQQQQQAWGHGSRSTSAVGDYGGVIKSGVNTAGSPLSALLWQNSSTGAGSRQKTTSTPTSIKPSTVRSSTKAAKRRRLTMASSMASPLVLPLSSTSLSTPPSKCPSSSLVSHSHSHSQPSPSISQKTRKELRREKKLLKKKMTTSSSPSSSMPQQPPSFFTTHPYVAHPNNASNNNNHHFHTHQHHPNSKTRGMSSSQRMGYYGGVPPLNL